MLQFESQCARTYVYLYVALTATVCAAMHAHAVITVSWRADVPADAAITAPLCADLPGDTLVEAPPPCRGLPILPFPG